MKVKLSELYKTDFNISDIFAMNQVWQDKFTFTMSHPRPTHGLLYFCGSDGVLTDSSSGKKTLYPAGTLVYIPKNATYSWTFTKRSEGVSSKLLEFSLSHINGEQIETDSTVTKIEQPYPGAYLRFFDSLISEYTKPAFAHPKIKAITYDFLYTLSDNIRKDAFSGTECIYKGIKYLEDDPIQDKSIKDIAAMCNVSINYFERLFKEYSGCTPTEYRINKKIDRAKILLEGGFVTVEQIATELGFADCAYFCRCFKKVTGITPTAYKSTKLKSDS